MRWAFAYVMAASFAPFCAVAAQELTTGIDTTRRPPIRVYPRFEWARGGPAIAFRPHEPVDAMGRRLPLDTSITFRFSDGRVGPPVRLRQVLAYRNAAEATLNQHGFTLRAMRDGDPVIKRIRHDTIQLRLQRERLAGLTQPGFVRPPDPRVRPANWKPLRFFRTAPLDSVSTTDARLAARFRSPAVARPRPALALSRHFSAPAAGPLTGAAARGHILTQALVMRAFGDSLPPSYADTGWTGWDETSGDDAMGSVTRTGSGYLFSSGEIATMSLNLGLDAELFHAYQPIAGLGITAGARRSAVDLVDLTLVLGDLDFGWMIDKEIETGEVPLEIGYWSWSYSFGSGSVTRGFPFSYARDIYIPFAGREISFPIPTEPLPLEATLGWRGDAGAYFSLELDTLSIRLSGNLWASVTAVAELSVDLVLFEPYVQGEVVLADHTYNFGGYNIIRPDQLLQAGSSSVPTYSAARQLWVTSELEALKGSIEAGIKGFGSVTVLDWGGVQLYKGEVVRVEDAVRLR